MRFAFGAVFLAVLAVVTALAAVGSGGSTPSAEATGIAAFKPIQQRLISGFAQGAMEQRAGLSPNTRTQNRGGQSQNHSPSNGCPMNRGANVRVNQNCLNLSDPDLQGRGQAQNETVDRAGPERSRHIVASSNDYRRGDGNCYSYYSSDGGRSGRTPRRRWASPAGTPSVASRASTGRPAATRRWRGTPRATPTCRARCSTAASAVSQQPGPVERVLRLPLDRHGRRVVELPGAPGGRAQRHGRQRHGAARQAAPDGRRPPRAARSRTAST